MEKASDCRSEDYEIVPHQVRKVLNRTIRTRGEQYFMNDPILIMKVCIIVNFICAIIHCLKENYTAAKFCAIMGFICALTIFAINYYGKVV